MGNEWEPCNAMSVVELAKAKQDNPDMEFRASYEGRYIELGWVGFFYKAVNDPQLFVTLFGIGEGKIGEGDRAPVARVDKMIHCLLVEKRKAGQMITPTEKTFTLSMPPSANRLWRMDKRGFMRKSAEAIAYYKAARLEAQSQGVEIIEGDVAITLRVYRARKSGDLDNRIKPLLDALQGMAFYDDKQVIQIHAFRFDDKKNPRVEVTIERTERIE